jgi:type 1 glutamine amidotransferase
MHTFALFGIIAILAAPMAEAAEKRILVYTRNFVTGGKGYVHDNIQSSVEAIRKMGAENGFAIDATDDPKVFTDGNLKKYAAVVFANSNDEAFENDEQRAAFRKFVESGRGYAGLHSASASERKWPYYWSVVGGKFVRHPKFQKFTVRVKDANHPATRGLPATFEWTDECYYHDTFSDKIKPLLIVDPAQLEDPKKAEYPGDRFGDALPLAWYKTEYGGRQFYTGLGHAKEHYSDPLLYKHILGGILWVMGEAK